MSDPHTGKDQAEKALEAYLAQVRRHLSPLPADEAREAIDELRSHVRDRSGGEGLTPHGVEAALAALGDPRGLAGLHLAERAAARAETDRSPWRVLAATWRLAGFSLAAAWALLVSAAGYAVGLGLLLLALIKPFAPDNIGLWIQPSPNDDVSVSIGRSLTPSGSEVLGWWLIPIGLLGGALVLFLTWRFGLVRLRRLGQARASLMSGRPQRS
jgi:hypothetical protein